MNEEKEILEFGIKRENEERRDGGCAVVFDPINQKYAVYKNLKNGHLGLFGGGFDDGENEKDGVLRELIEESGLIDFLYIEKIDTVLTHYFNSNKNVNRVALATCFLVILKSSKIQEAKLEEHENFQLLWLTPERILKDWESRNNSEKYSHCYDHWIYFMNKAVLRAKELGYDAASILENIEEK